MSLLAHKLHNPVSEAPQTQAKVQLQILMQAYKNDCLEIIENINIDIEREFYYLLTKGYIKENNAPFNCQPFRDQSGYLHQFRYISLTKLGLDSLRKRLMVIKYGPSVFINKRAS